jgi:hypothetical protein
MAAEAAPPSRLMITHMRMVNFKSYLGIQEVGPFHQVRPQLSFEALQHL